MDIRGQWSRKNTREISQQESVDAYYKPIALSLSSNGYIFRPYKFGRTPVAVISAGETQGICVAAYKTNEFPVFFTERSGCENLEPGPNRPYRLGSLHLPETNLKLMLGSGILIAVPIPKEHTASGGFIESAIQILHKWKWILWDKNITGIAETPFLLAEVNELTGSIDLNSSLDIALVKNNALAGDKIAVALLRSRNILIEVMLSGRHALKTGFTWQPIILRVGNLLDSSSLIHVRALSSGGQS
ncbi:hypothetical protein NC651_022015 [Populus alba x Populus x berolinensis]|nr:hypothetical protein NC651_022015 [Populus alba x Populus x berolinensis]